MLATLDELRDRHGVWPKTLGTDTGYEGGPFYPEVEGRETKPHGGSSSGCACPRRSGRTSEPVPRRVTG